MTLVCLLSMTTISLAASGKAMIAPYVTESSSTGTVCKSYIYLSNITDAPLSIKMTLYKTDGSVLLDTGNSISSGEIAGDSLGDYSENVTNGSVSFSLAAHSSGRVRITSSDYRIGYGIIEWTQDSQVAYGLIATGESHASLSSGVGFCWNININNGLPF